MEPVIVIGAGLAGSEAAWQLAQRGIPVELREMKPQKMTPAHHSGDFGELVCSNSLRSDQLENAVGLLKEELRRCGSLIMACADAHRVEAGGALAVDRHAFSAAITEKIRSHPNITVVEGEVLDIPEEGNVIVASGPLTSDPLAQAIASRYPQNSYLHFFDAAPGLPPGTTGAPRITSTAPSPRRSTRHSGRPSPPPRRRRSTALRTPGYLRAACPWRSWPGGDGTPCATAP